MTFSETQFDHIQHTINQGLQDLSATIPRLQPAAEAGLDHWYVPGFVKDAVRWLVDKAVRLASTVLDKIIEVMRGVTAPIWFFHDSLEWQDLRGLASDVAGQLTPDAMRATDQWHGEAATAYRGIITPQGHAAAQLVTIADTTSTSLGICASAGVAFYVTIGVILAKFIVAMFAVIAAFASVALSWAGVALAVEEAGVNTSLIAGAPLALAASLTVQAQQMSVLHGQALDSSAFPGGTWPHPLANTFNNASVQDGTAHWSLQQP